MMKAMQDQKNADAQQKAQQDMADAMKKQNELLQQALLNKNNNDSSTTNDELKKKIDELQDKIDDLSKEKNGVTVLSRDSAGNATTIILDDGTIFKKGTNGTWTKVTTTP